MLKQVYILINLHVHAKYVERLILVLNCPNPHLKGWHLECRPFHTFLDASLHDWVEFLQQIMVFNQVCCQ